MRFLIENKKGNIIVSFTGLVSAEKYIKENPDCKIVIFNNKVKHNAKKS